MAIALHLDDIKKEQLERVAKMIGIKKDFARVSKDWIASQIAQRYASGEDGRKAVRVAIYATGPQSWEDIDAMESAKKDYPAIETDTDAANPKDDTGTDTKPQDARPDEEGDEEGDEKKQAKAMGGEMAKQLAHIIRDSEKTAQAQAMLHGMSAIAPVHEPLIEALSQFGGQILQMAGSSEEIDAKLAAIEEQVYALRDSMVSGKMVTSEIEVTSAASGETIKIDGLAHKQFPELLQIMDTRNPDGSRLNVWIVGPAGSGKTHSAVQAAKALGLPFYSNGSFMTKHEAVGYMNATGGYVKTAFRQAWENGGVFLADEIDGSVPNAVVGINQALSTPLFTFPDAVVPRHPDFVFLGAANSYGHGSADYVGRFKQDVAALDRFAYLLWEYDEALELAFATNKAWAKRVQKARARAIEKGMKVVISPRATLAGCALLAKGLKMDRVDALVLRKGMSDDQWSSLEMGA